MSKAIYPSSRHDRPHARLYDHDLNHAAWTGLSSNAFKIIACLLASYRPNKANSFPVGEKRISDDFKIPKAAVKRAIDELIKKGHLRQERKGRNRGHVASRERVVSLTRFDTDIQAGDSELPIKIWRENT